MAEILGGRPNRFLTLTIRPEPNETPENAVKRLNAAWRTLRARICREHKIKTVPHMTVVEKHKSGMPHLHIFLRCPYLKFDWLKAQMEDIANAPHVFIQHLHAKKRAAAYAAKYCTKADAQIGNAKRYYKARSYETRPPREEEAKNAFWIDWDRLQTPIETLARRRKDAGWSTFWESCEHCLAIPPPLRCSWADAQQRRAQWQPATPAAPARL